MGGMIDTLFGGSKSSSTSTSTSGNKAFDFLRGALGGNVATGNSAFERIGALLGLDGDKAAADAGFNNYLSSTGHNFMLDQGSKAITGNAAARGLLSSGSTAKALTEFGQNLGKTNFNNYLTQLGSLFQGGLGSAQTIGGAGGYSTGTSASSGKSQPGILPVLFG